MNARAALLGKLRHYPELVFSEAPSSIRIQPPVPDGFAIELRNDGLEWVVYLGEAGFHETFQNDDEVLNFIAWCYSGEARVREFWCGQTPRKAVLEALNDGHWAAVSETGYFLFRFWQESREVVLWNPNILKR